MVKFYVGLDLGQTNDYTALSILEKAKEGNQSVYHVRKLERTRGTPYPEIVDKVTKIMRSPDLIASGAVLVVDQTGVGAPVVDLFRKAGLRPVGVLIHGGDRAMRDGDTWRVPKRDLVGTLQVLLQNNRLKISWKLQLAKILSGEMLNFRIKIDPKTAHDSYSAWREDDHDDLLLSVAIAGWMGERSRPRRSFKVPTEAVCYGSDALDAANAALGQLPDDGQESRGSWLQVNGNGTIRMKW